MEGEYGSEKKLTTLSSEVRSAFWSWKCGSPSPEDDCGKASNWEKWRRKKIRQKAMVAIEGDEAAFRELTNTASIFDPNWKPGKREKADDYDNILVEEFGAIWKPSTTVFI